MGDITGFLKVKRSPFKYRDVEERKRDYKEVFLIHPEEKIKEQASRCMDCGTPFCNWGCPIGNYIPEWNDKVYKGLWEEAFLLLNETNPLPEVTGRVCPALCEYSCVLGINDDPVTIRDNELFIIEKAFKEGYIKPNKNIIRTNKKVAVVGSGPAGLSCAHFLNRMGHTVTVFEKDDRIGGFMRYGIPDFKLDKSVLERRKKIMEEEDIEFRTNTFVGKDYSVDKLLKEFDAVCIAIGCRVPRDLKVEGRELDGIYFAVDYLEQSNRIVAGDKIENKISAKDKNVVVIGGGDTGADCVGTAIRQGAKKVVQIEIMPKPPETRPEGQEWPKYPFILRTSTSHEEGDVERKWSVLTKKIIGENGKVKKLLCCNVEFIKEEGKDRPVMREIPGSEFEIPADLVILAMGFTNPEKLLLEKIGIELNQRGSVKVDENGKTNIEKVFAAGDVKRGPSLIVWAIYEGRKVAEAIDAYLMKNKK